MHTSATVYAGRLDDSDVGTCEACEEPVCYDCARQAQGPWECIDYSICKECYELRELDQRSEAWEADRQRSAKNKAARARYWSPEQRAKRTEQRKAAKAAKAAAELERRRQNLKNLIYGQSAPRG